jgi:hypothetical protein
MDPLNPILGQFVFDGTEFVSYAVDLPPGGCQGLQLTRQGFLAACEELIANQAEWGAKAGINDLEIEDLSTINQRVARIDVFLPPMKKAVEMLIETRCMLDDKRQRIILDAAKSVDRRSRKQPGLAAKYEKTRVYRSVIAKKALKTKKDAQLAAARGNDAPPPAPPAIP